MHLFGSPRRARSAAGLAIVAASSALLAGCVSITHQEAAQLDGVGDVAVSLDLCQSDSFFYPATDSLLDEKGCVLSDPFAADKQVQLFVTYAIPTGVGAPAELTVPGGAAGDKLVADDADTAAITDSADAPAGHKWVTYRSTPTDAASADEDAPQPTGRITANFDVSGLSGDFTYGALVSWRYVSTDPAKPAYAADRPVTCGGTGTTTDPDATPTPLPTWNTDSVSDLGSGSYTLPGTACADAMTPKRFFPMVLASERSGRDFDTATTTTPFPVIPSVQPIPTITFVPPPTSTATPVPTASPEPTATPKVDPTIATDDGFTLLTIPVNRLKLADAPEQTVTAGDSASLTFGAKSSLGGSAVSVPLAGTTTIPGATVSTDASLAIGGPTTVGATVKVPAGTAAGDYTVTLNAGVKTGLRTAKGTLHVKAAPAAAAAATPTPAPAPAATANRTAQDALELQSETLADIVQKSKKTKQLRTGAATVPVTVSGAGTVRVTIHSRKKVGKNFVIYAVGSAYAKKAGSVDVTIKRTDAGRELLKGDEPVKATLVVRFTGSGGKLVAPGIPITLD